MVYVRLRRCLYTELKQVVGVSVNIVEYIVRLLVDLLVPPTSMWWCHVILKVIGYSGLMNPYGESMVADSDVFSLKWSPGKIDRERIIV
jgi:hypothetical protein